MTRKANDFDGIAPWYDFLVKIVFGRSMRRAQELYLDLLPAEGRVLILGGGSGWIAESLLRLHPEQRVTFVEASMKMLEMAEEKLREKSHQITFIHGTHENIPEGVYEGIITNFFLDLFSTDDLSALIHRLRKHFKAGGYWIITDFVEEKWWHRPFLRTMYTFFKVTSNIGATQLPRWQGTMKKNGVREINSASFYGGFICTKLYQLTE
jgi:tRNA (cmo5U34)-methyltransferase